MLSPSTLGVQDREGLERVHRGLHDEGQVGELDPAALLVGLAVLLAQRVDAGHVDLEDGGDVGGGPLRQDHVLGGLPADGRHGHDLDARARPGDGGRRTPAGGGLGAGGGGREPPTGSAEPAARPAAGPRRAAERRPPAGAARSAGRPSRWPRMSCLVTRPAIPVPGISRMSTLCSAAILRTTGEERVCRSSSTVISRAASRRPAAGAGAERGRRLRGLPAEAARAAAPRQCGGSAAALGGGGGAAARRRGGVGRGRARRARRGRAAAAPRRGAGRGDRLALGRDHAHDGVDGHGRARARRGSPSARRRPGDGISASTLSVEISKSGSSRWTLSPTFFIHLVTVPSAMDSPIWGMITSVIGVSILRSAQSYS